MAKRLAVIDQSRCVACGVCVKACPKAAILIWKGCYARVEETVCVGCGKCAGECPAGCISAVEREAVL